MARGHFAGRRHCYNRQKHFLTGFLLASFPNRPRPRRRPRPLVEAWHRDKTVNAGRQPGAQACTRDTHLFAFMNLLEVEDENDDEGRERLGEAEEGELRPHHCGYRLSQSGRSIGSALRQQPRAFPYRVPACFLPQSCSSSSSFSSSAFGLRRVTETRP
jgi:hypothetical protein